MAVLTADQVAYYKRKLGASTDMIDVAARVDRLTADGTYSGTSDDIDVVVEILEERRATLAATPEQFAIPGEYSQSTVGNMKLLDRQLQDAIAERDSGEEVDGGFVFVQAPANREPSRHSLDTEEFLARSRSGGFSLDGR